MSCLPIPLTDIILFLWDIVVVVQSLSCVKLCKLIDCSRLGFPVFHHVPELSLTQVHWADDAIQHLIFCCPLFSQYQGLSQWVNSAWCGRSIAASAFVLPMNIQHWFPLGLTDLISLQSKGHSRVFSSTTVCLLWCLAFFMVQLSHPYKTTGNKQTKNSFYNMYFHWQSDISAFKMLYRFVIVFLPESKFCLFCFVF